MLPQIKSSSEIYGLIKSSDFPNEFQNVPISGCLGDQQAALVGQNCLEGMAKATYGTGAFILYNTGEKMVQSNHGLLTTVAYQLGPNSKPFYALEGSVATAGSGLDWFKNSFELKESTQELIDLASSVDDTLGVYFVPSFTGLLAPRWRPDSRALVIGLSLSTKKAHIIRAIIESIAFQVADIIKSIQKDSKNKIEILMVDGGLSQSDFLMQIQANMIDTNVTRPFDIESTSRGAAFVAGLAVGLWSNQDFHFLKQEKKTFESKINDNLRKKILERWENAIARSYNWAEE